MIAPRGVVDRWNYIINGLCVTVRDWRPVRLGVGCPRPSCHASGLGVDRRSATPGDPLETTTQPRRLTCPRTPRRNLHADALLPWLPPQSDDAHGLLANTSRATPAAPMALGQPA